MGILTTIGVVSLIGYVAKKASSLKQVTNNMEISLSGERVGLSYNGIPVTLSYIIKKPVKESIELSLPLIKIKVDGKQLTSSTMSINDVPTENRTSKGRILVKGESQTEPITVTILFSWFAILKVGMSAYNRFQSKEPVKIEVETFTQAYTSLGRFAYDDKSI